MNISPRRTRTRDRKTQTGAAETEAAMIRYTSRIAQTIPSFEAFFINEHADGQVGADGWNIQGWLNAEELRSVDHREMSYNPSHCFSIDENVTKIMLPAGSMPPSFASNYSAASPSASTQYLGTTFWLVLGN
ncbi:hypothetical protein BT96DRAFT_990525 [Gymnopus androsaceus JB14]|uniref:Uncharacterized protein n=1 Tax=Gymnopus androsaceus JB14 TaxID=1447944 RepID=A0A6A4I0V1_9AGAR|nr:hypothetical protein BT96DRAFT_990525 [Gymnopus androsaceus JB14]